MTTTTNRTYSQPKQVCASCGMMSRYIIVVLQVETVAEESDGQEKESKSERKKCSVCLLTLPFPLSFPHSIVFPSCDTAYMGAAYQDSTHFQFGDHHNQTTSVYTGGNLLSMNCRTHVGIIYFADFNMESVRGAQRERPASPPLSKVKLPSELCSQLLRYFAYYLLGVLDEIHSCLSALWCRLCTSSQ